MAATARRLGASDAQAAGLVRLHVATTLPQMPQRYRSADCALAGLSAPPRDRVGERALERDLRLPARRGAQAAGIAADLHHLVGAHEVRVDLRASRPSIATSSPADAVRPEQTL